MKRLKGKLSKEQLAEFDSLLLELKDLNIKALNTEKLRKGTVIPFDKIRPLPKEKNEKLWSYIRHYSKIVVMSPKNLGLIRSMVWYDDTQNLNSLIEDATIEVAIWVYRFGWRQYEHSEDCGYVFTTANYGFTSWSSMHKRWGEGKESWKELIDDAEQHNNEVPRKTGTTFSEIDFPLRIDDLESSMTNP